MNLEMHNTEQENALASPNKYFALYCDLLGFSDDMTDEGSSLLFDYYGTAWVGAGLYPSIRTYLFSDSLVAFVEEKDISLIPDFIAWHVNQWSADGLLYQCFIGYGTFIEGRSNFGSPLRNFFGSEIHGTALVDAANIQKTKPLGARILMSQHSGKHLLNDQSFYIAKDKFDNLELFIQKSYEIVQGKDGNKYTLHKSDKHYINNCYYYLSILCNQKRNRVFDHYVWSIASRVFKIGKIEFNKVIQRVDSKYTNRNIDVVIDAVDEILKGYKPVQH